MNTSGFSSDNQIPIDTSSRIKGGGGGNINFNGAAVVMIVNSVVPSDLCQYNPGQTYSHYLYF